MRVLDGSIVTASCRCPHPSLLKRWQKPGPCTRKLLSSFSLAIRRFVLAGWALASFALEMSGRTGAGLGLQTHRVVDLQSALASRRPRSYSHTCIGNHVSRCCLGYCWGDLPYSQKNGQSTQPELCHRAKNSLHFSGPATDRPRVQSLIPPKRADASLLALTRVFLHLVDLHGIQPSYETLTIRDC